MRHGKLLAESVPHELLEQFHCSSLEEAFLKLCEAHNTTLNETYQGFREDTDSDILCQNRNKYKQTKVYIEIIYALFIVIKSYVNLYYFVTQINRIVKAISECKAVSERRVSRLRRFKALLAKNGIQFLRYYT